MAHATEKDSRDIPTVAIGSDVSQVVASFLAQTQITGGFTEAPVLSEAILEEQLLHLDADAQEERCLLFDVTEEALADLFEEHVRCKDPIHQFRIGPRMAPPPMSFEQMVQKTCAAVEARLSYSLKNNENLDELLNQDFKKEELTWKRMEEDMTIRDVQDSVDIIKGDEFYGVY